MRNKKKKYKSPNLRRLTSHEPRSHDAPHEPSGERPHKSPTLGAPHAPTNVARACLSWREGSAFCGQGGQSESAEAKAGSATWQGRRELHAESGGGVDVSYASWVREGKEQEAGDGWISGAGLGMAS